MAQVASPRNGPHSPESMAWLVTTSRAAAGAAKPPGRVRRHRPSVPSTCGYRSNCMRCTTRSRASLCPSDLLGLIDSDAAETGKKKGEPGKK